MNIVLTGHFQRRYKERVGYFSAAATRKKLAEELENFPDSILQAKFEMGEHCVVVRRNPGSRTWFAVTISRKTVNRKIGGVKSAVSSGS